MTEVTPQNLISRIVDEFDSRGWRDVNNGALSVARAIERGQHDLDALAKLPSGTFLARNGAPDPGKNK